MPTTRFLTGDGRRRDVLYVCGTCGATQWSSLRGAPKCPERGNHGRMSPA